MTLPSILNIQRINMNIVFGLLPKRIDMRFQSWFTVLLSVISLAGCQQGEIRFAVSEQDENYREFAYYLQEVLEETSMKLEVIEVDNSRTAANMVASKDADLCG